MKSLLIVSVAALAACVPAEPVAMTPGEQGELSAALAGRVSGPPQACVNLRDIRGNRSVGEGAILFKGATSSVVYLNRPPAGCPDLRGTRTLVTRTPTGRLCRGDIATVVDLSSGGHYGGCGLGDFVPYRRVR